MRYVLACLTAFFLMNTSAAQVRKDTSIFRFPIEMDEFVLKATRDGWDIDAFIRRVKDDTTFYKAFKTLHIVPWTATHDIRILNNKNGVKASLNSKTKQLVQNRCRSMQVLEEKTTGDFYDRKKDYNYYTAELYAYLFFTKEPVCNETNIVRGSDNDRGKGQLEKHKWQLKQLIFNPGSKVAGVPFAGSKAAIFEPDMAKKYDFKLMLVEYSGEDCYLFTAKPKPEYKNDVIYNELSTWFRKSDYTIMARDYSLSYKTMLYDFDVKMKVRLREVGGKLVPTFISYGGNWHVATKKRERAQFTAQLSF